MLLRNNNDYKSIVWDTETESLNLHYARPWQLSYLICKGNVVEKVVDRFLWWKDLKVSDDAARITRFDYNNYKQRAEDPKKVYEEFHEYLYNINYLNIGQNTLGYDIFIANTLRRCLGLKVDWSYLQRAYDTNCLGKFLLFNNPHPIQDNRLLWQMKLRNMRQKGTKTSLSALSKHFNIIVNEDTRHDGLVDVRLNKDVWQQFIYSIEI